MKPTDSTTCLFTGERLTAETKLEHTIQRALGGRIRSQRVSSDDFNQRCGNHIDLVLISRYAQLMHVLWPLLPSQSRPGQLDVDVPGEPTKYVFREGLLTRRDEVLEWDRATGKPLKVVAADRDALRKFAQKRKMDESTLSVVPLTEPSVAFVRGVPSFSAELEVAALKSALLTFDHLLDGCERRFTRQDRLKDVRSFVKQAVMTSDVDPKGSYQFCVGMQYDRLHRYRQMRKKILTRESPFEHMMLAAGSASHRVVDLVWVILGFDPFGLRLCRDWDGGDFSFGFVNGVLADTTKSEACSLGLLDSPLCRPNDLKAVSREMQCPSHEIGFAKYEEAFKEATYLVQKDDKHVRECIFRAAEVDGDKERNATTQIRKRLRRLYPTTSGPAFPQVLEGVFDRHTSGLTPTQLEQSVLRDGREGDIDWGLWLRVFHECLDDLVSEFGLPGHIFLDKHVAESTPVRLG